MTTDRDVWLTRKEVATRTKKAEKTLAQWACKGYGPVFRKFGSQCRYRLSDLIAWENAQVEHGDTSTRSNSVTTDEC
jgi:hypothetical protein